MRATIQARIADELSAIEGRCYGVGEPTDETEKPFATVRLAEQAIASPWLGRRRTYEIALYVEKNGADELDQLTEQTILALHDVQLPTDSSFPEFTCRYEGTTDSERVDETLQALVQVLQFSVYAVGCEDEGSPDSWLDALCEWTESQASIDWNVYRQRWPQSYESPAVMWRLEHMEAADSSSSAIELRKKAVGHLIGRTEEERQTMLAQLVSQLGSATKLTLDTIANRYISIDEISGNFQADGLTVGQLSVSMRQRINKSVPSGPLMSHIQYYGGFG